MREVQTSTDEDAIYSAYLNAYGLAASGGRCDARYNQIEERVAQAMGAEHGAKRTVFIGRHALLEAVRQYLTTPLE